eukprot:scaffold458_cov169-Ochromonas_danica.AAC.3
MVTSQAARDGQQVSGLVLEEAQHCRHARSRQPPRVQSLPLPAALAEEAGDVFWRGGGGGGGGGEGEGLPWARLASGHWAHCPPSCPPPPPPALPSAALPCPRAQQLSP